MGSLKVLGVDDFLAQWKSLSAPPEDRGVRDAVEGIIERVRKEGDRAVRDFAARFDRSSPETLELSRGTIDSALAELERREPELVESLRWSAEQILRFARLQREQCADFEAELEPGVFAGQRVIPVGRAAVYVPAGRFPLVSTVLMGVLPAKAAGVGQVVVASPPLEDGLPDRRILAAAALAGADRVFALGGAQAIAALALGTESVPRSDVVVGPGNKYVAEAKRRLFGEVGIDFVAGPTDVLIVADGAGDRLKAADLIAADMLAQAEHDPDARARALVGDFSLADAVQAAVERRLSTLSTADTARASLQAGGLIVVYRTREEALAAADAIAPEHLELHLCDAESWVPLFKNYGSLFIGSSAAEVLGDYSAGINHTLPTSGSARFTGGLSVRHFLKFATSLRTAPGPGYDRALGAAERIARAEGLAGHAEAANARKAKMR
jgi:histidinol dehydrogenase